MSELRPMYYLRHATPVGDRYAYPVPELGGYPRYGSAEITWTAPGAVVERAGEWLITDAPLGEVTGSWQLAPQRVGWRKRDTSPEEEYKRILWETAPDEPFPEALEHAASGCDSFECFRCDAFRAIYEVVMGDPERRCETVSYAGWVPLPGEPDPAPDTTWVLSDPSMCAVYGRHTAHLWPGSIPGFRDALYKLLEADPRVEHVFDAKYHVGHQRPGTLATTVRVPWETPRTKLVGRYGARGQKLRGKKTVPDPIAHSARTTLAVPADLSAPTKREALERWDQELAEFVDRLVPVDVVACDRCDGHGHLLRERVPESDLTMVDLRERYDG